MDGSDSCNIHLSRAVDMSYLRASYINILSLQIFSVDECLAFFC